MKIVTALALFLALFGCSKTNDSQSISDTLSSFSQNDSLKSKSFDYEYAFNLESYLTKSIADTANVQRIDFDCAILVYPTDKQIEKIKKDEGEEAFYVIADDNSWYQSQAINMIDSVGITKQSATKQYLHLVGEKKEWFVDIRKDDLPAWNLIFFKKNKQPEIISDIDLTTRQIKDYFEVAK